MEGFGQYTMYVWLIDARDGNIDKKLALKAVRRDGRNWSQEQGFGMCTGRLVNNYLVQYYVSLNSQCPTTPFRSVFGRGIGWSPMQ